MNDQNGLFSGLELNEALGKKILELLEEAIHKEIGFKDFCHQIKKEEAQVRDALNSNGKYFSITWVPFVLSKSPIYTQKLLNLFCDIAKLSHPEPIKEKTIEEELAELKEFKARVLGLTKAYEK